MVAVHRVGELEIDTDERFQRREWVVQRVGWMVMAALVLAALLGVTGRGPVARAAIGDRGGPLRVAYERFDRMDADSALRVHIGPEATGGEQVAVWIAADYLAGVEIETIAPEPVEVRDGPDRTVYIFAVDQPNQALSATFRLRHDGFGRQTGEVGLVDGPSRSFRQIVFP